MFGRMRLRSSQPNFGFANKIPLYLAPRILFNWCDALPLATCRSQALAWAVAPPASEARAMRSRVNRERIALIKQDSRCQMKRNLVCESEVRLR